MRMIPLETIPGDVVRRSKRSAIQSDPIHLSATNPRPRPVPWPSRPCEDALGLLRFGIAYAFGGRAPNIHVAYSTAGELAAKYLTDGGERIYDCPMLWVEYTQRMERGELFTRQSAGETAYYGVVG